MTASPVPDDVKVPATFRYSAFFDLLADAAFQHQYAKQATDSYIMSRFARASVLASALSVECAANCLLTSLDLSRPLFSEMDRLTPVAKIEAYLRLRAITGFNRGSNVVQRVAELVRARNDHVHPKTTAIPASVTELRDGGENWILPFNIEGEHWDQLRIPKRSMFWSDSSSLAALSAVTSFFTYLFVTLLKANEDELHRVLASRLEIGDAHILAVFDEIRIELQSTAAHGVDFSFFGLFPSQDNTSADLGSFPPAHGDA